MAVAGLVAITSANGAVLGSYEHSMEELSGRVDLEVGTGDNPLPETLLEPLTHVRGVNHISPVIEAKARYAANRRAPAYFGTGFNGRQLFFACCAAPRQATLTHWNFLTVGAACCWRTLLLRVIICIRV